jgi:hypothetical protein
MALFDSERGWAEAEVYPLRASARLPLHHDHIDLPSQGGGTST